MKVIVLFVLSALILQFGCVANAATEQQSDVGEFAAAQQKAAADEDSAALQQEGAEIEPKAAVFDAGLFVSIFGVFVGLLIFGIQARQNKKLKTQSDLIAVQNRKLADLAQKMDKNITLLDKKVFGSLYTIGDTVRSMLEFIDATESPRLAQDRPGQDNDLYIMAYWLWFGIDDQWYSESDISSIRDSELYKKIVRRIEDHKKRGNESKTVVIVYDPAEKRDELVDMISGIIRYKAIKKEWDIAEDKIKKYSEEIYQSYSNVLNKMIEQVERHCGKGEKDEIFFSKKIPNIIFAQRYNGVANGISFLGEIDFLNQSFRTAQPTSTSVDLEISEFFGFQTHDPQMVASLIKQISVIIEAGYTEPAKTCLTRQMLVPS